MTPKGARRPLRILHTSDLHGSLTPVKAARLRILKADADLWLDAGDAIGRPKNGLGDDPTLRLLAEAGCDAMVPGNHEYLALAGESPVTMLAANLVGAKSAPDAIFIRSGWRIGVIGVATPWLKFSSRPLKRLGDAERAFAEGFAVTDPFGAARDRCDRLRPQTDLLILLSHLGAEGDVKLARAAPIADAILGGHSHELSPPTLVHGAFVARAGVGATHVGAYRWDGASLTGELVPL